MEYIDSFYFKLQELIKEARVHVALFLPMMSEQDLTKKYGILWKRKSLLGQLKSFNKQPYGLMELIYLNKSIGKKFSAFYTKRTVNRQCTDFEFIKPLTAFAEGFAVIDGRDVLVQPDAQHADNGAFLSVNNQECAFYFQGLFNQITKHENQLDQYQPTETFLNLATTKQATQEMVRYFYEIQSHKITDTLPNNPFVNRLIKKYEENKRL